MDQSWEDILQQYLAQHFQVFPRETFFHAPLDTLLHDLPIAPSTRTFVEQLADPEQSIWRAFFLSIQSVHKEMKEDDVFAPLRLLLDRAVHVAVLYGEHRAWKSPDAWSYLFEIDDPIGSDSPRYFIAHAPATLEHIRQTEKVIGMKLPPQYVRFLTCTNGAGLALDELEYICGVGDARAAWDTVVNFDVFAIPRDSYHEMAWYWQEWQQVLAYERQRDDETGISTFRSDERSLVPFAYLADDWCFDRSQLSQEGESPVLFWDHEMREAKNAYPDFQAWFLDWMASPPLRQFFSY